MCIFTVQIRTKCENYTLQSSKNFHEMAEYIQQPMEYTCPRDFDPVTHTMCCHDGNCCEPTLVSMAPVLNKIHNKIFFFPPPLIILIIIFIFLIFSPMIG